MGKTSKRASATASKQAGGLGRERSGGGVAEPARGASPAEPLTAAFVREKLRPLEDPELGLSIVDLGLVREIHLSATHLQVDLTLTSPMCPWGPELVASVRSSLRAIAPNREPVVSLVWEPPWDPARDPTEDARAELGIWT